MKLLLQVFALVALVIAVVAIGLFLLSRGVEPTEEIVLELPAYEGPERVALPAIELPKGGVFEGLVVDEDGTGIPDAMVLLVAFDTGDALMARAPQDPDEFDPANIARIGYRTAAETRTDADGRFSVAADAGDAIRVVAAWQKGFTPTLVAVEKPEAGIRVVLQAAGRFVGRVVDKDTNLPVVGAQIALYLQQRAAPPGGAVGETTTPGRVRYRLSPMAAAQRWVARELGPRVWEVPWNGDETLRLYSDRDGIFRFGPIGDEVQLEFVITHPDYMWTEFDVGEDERVRRTVVKPGEVVERTFPLERGKTLRGRVLDEEGRGVPDVLVSVHHVAQYTQHWWYRTKSRNARTAKDGSFEVGGLSFGPWKVTIQHPAFGRQEPHAYSEEDAARGIQIYVENRGGIRARIEGVQDLRFGQQVDLTLERQGETPEEVRFQRERVQLGQDGTFALSGVKPGRYRAWVRVGSLSSQPEDLEVRSLEETAVVFTLGGGGALTLRVYDERGRIVDPASVVLVSVGEDDAPAQALGHFVTREGLLDAEGLLPGRYRAQVSAPGFFEVTSEPFDVVEDRATDAGSVTLRRPAFLAFQGFEGPNGRAHRGAVFLFLTEGDRPERPLTNLGGSEVPIRAGPITLRATTPEGLRYEETFEVADGEVLPVTVRLAP